MLPNQTYFKLNTTEVQTSLQDKTNHILIQYIDLKIHDDHNILLFLN